MKKFKLEDLIFVIIVVLILVGGFTKPFLKPSSVNGFENRESYQMPKFQLSSFIKKDYQNEMEMALSDQIPLSQRLKHVEKKLRLDVILNYYQSKDSFKYHYLGEGIEIFNGYLVYGFNKFNKEQNPILLRAQNINDVSERVTDASFYVYYVERDLDINFETNEKSGAYEYLKEQLNSSIKVGRLKIDNFDDYQNDYSKTDHHWNYIGAYNGYLDLVDLLEIKEEPIEPKKEICTRSIMNGSKERLLGVLGYFKEQFCGYMFDFEEHDVFINFQKSEKYTDAEEVIKGTYPQVIYGTFFGGDYGFLEFNFHVPDKENLLIIGDSYDNAVNELLASHFNKTYNVDLRHYKRYSGEEFNIDKFVKEHEIDKVLIIGNYNFFVMDDFVLKGEM